MPAIATRQPAPNSINDTVALPPRVPDLPDDILARFPSLVDWKEGVDKWWTRTNVAIQQFAGSVGDEVDSQSNTGGDLFVQFNAFTAAITTEVEAIADEQGAQAKRIVTVSAMSGVSQHIKVQSTAPVSPAVSDYWIDNTVLTLPITYQWDGANWNEVTTPISAVAVSDERTARVTAVGNLEGKYTLTVIAGDVVTGMNITSSSGPGTNVSSVIFRASDFKIYNGTTGITMFSVSGSAVNLAGTLTVSTSGKVFIGVGTYGNTNTPWYVDSSGFFSLGNKLTWDGTTLTIAGGFSAISGSIGGWDINPTTLSKNNAILDSAGQLALGTSNDVVILSATNGTYRLWAGNVTAGSATFSVTKAGALFSTSGMIGGFTILTNSLVASSGSTLISLSNDAGTGILLGDSSSFNALLRRSIGGTSGLYLRNSASDIAASLEGRSTGMGRLTLANSGILEIDIDAGHLFLGMTFRGDTNLYRASANLLKTDDTFSCVAVKYGSGNAISFTWDGANIKCFVDGTAQGTIPNP